MPHSADVKRILKLSVAERVQIVEDIWDSITDQEEDLPVPPEHLAIIKERLALRKTRGRSTKTWDEVKRDVINSL